MRDGVPSLRNVGLTSLGSSGERGGHNDPADFSPAEVFAACRKALEANFVPSYLQVVDEIPKTASEKPQERFLLEAFAPAGPGVFTEGR